MSTLADPIKNTRDRPMSGNAPRRGVTRPAVALSAMSIVPAVIVAVWLLVAIPLLAVGAFRPLFALPALFALLVPASAVARRLVLNSAAVSYRTDVTRWSTLSVAGIAATFVVTNGLLHAEKVILRRDAAAYSLIGHWLAQHTEKIVPTGMASFGGPDPSLDPASQAFYPHAGALVPQFMSGLPATLAAVEWGSSWRATLWVPPLLGGLALLAFAGLVARLVGPRWAPLGALLLGLAEPFWNAARAALTEPMAAVLLLAALCLIVDAVRSDDGIAAMAGGLLFGVCTTVRVDTLREIVLLIPVAGWLALRGSPLWRWLVLGSLIGLGLGEVDAALLTKPYVLALRDSLLPLIAFAAVLAVATMAGVWVLRRRVLTMPRWAGRLVSAVIVGSFIVFVIRPAVQTVHGNPAGSLGALDVAARQRAQGLPVDGTRTYDEWSMHWLAWWLGWVTLIVAVFGTVMLVRRLVDSARRGTDRGYEWVAPLLIVLGTTALTLWRPGISPDHPWADRRFVPIVLPGLILLACFGANVIYRRLRLAVHEGSRLPAIVLGCVVAAVAVPIVWASAPLFAKRAEVGSIGAIDKVCANLGSRDAVLVVDGRARAEWPAALRSECGVPVAKIVDLDRPTVDRLVARVRAAGHRPVLFAAESPDSLLKLGFSPRLVVDLSTTEDQTVLMRRPDDTQRLRISVWLGDV